MLDHPGPKGSQAMDVKQWFTTVCQRNRLNVSDLKIDLIDRYAHELLEWNKKINLVSRKDEQNLWIRHLLGSISFLFQYSVYPNTAIADIGTGGGLPGIPIAILIPECRVTLIESIRKKTMAVSEIVNTLQLSNVTVVNGRAEELSGRKEYVSAFDYVISRAAGSIWDLINWSKPFLKTPTWFCANSSIV